MGKDTKADRKATKPSSSSRAAEVLANKSAGAGGFGFGGYASRFVIASHDGRQLRQFAQIGCDITPAGRTAHASTFPDALPPPESNKPLQRRCLHTSNRGALRFILRTNAPTRAFLRLAPPSGTACAASLAGAPSAPMSPGSVSELRRLPALLPQPLPSAAQRLRRPMPAAPQLRTTRCR